MIDLNSRIICSGMSEAHRAVGSRSAFRRQAWVWVIGAALWAPLPSSAYFALNFMPNTSVTDTTGDANGYQGGRHLSSCFFTSYGY